MLLYYVLVSIKQQVTNKQTNKKYLLKDYISTYHYYASQNVFSPKNHLWLLNRNNVKIISSQYTNVTHIILYMS